MPKTLNKRQIKAILPHRAPFLFIDKVIEIDGKKRVVAVKKILKNEPFFQGHFPRYPIMPGVLIIEAMAQTSIILYYLNKSKIAKSQPNYYLGKVKAEFTAPVFPGETLLIEAKKVIIIDTACIIDTLAHVNNNAVAFAHLVFSIKPQDNGRC
jgi:3-hydroxyacyl-[acyl-carrier-protein] dehydratase